MVFNLFFFFIDIYVLWKNSNPNRREKGCKVTAIFKKSLFYVSNVFNYC